MREVKEQQENDNGLQYTGEWLSDKRHGFGKQQFDNGDVYFGQWRDDLQEGDGTFQKQGYKYVGQWSLGHRHGNGKEYWIGPNDALFEEYDGEFKFGQRNGLGTMKYTDGSLYDGTWSNDQRIGRGQLTLEDR